MQSMLILLPPSETKARGGDCGPLDLDSLSFSALNETRKSLIDDLRELSADASVACEVLGLGPKSADEVELNAELITSPTTAALDRYTGVLFEALDPATLAAKARGQLAVGSALFGVVGGEDLIPAYRLSGTVKLPLPDGSLPTMRKRWGRTITETLAGRDDLIVDLRSGTYQNLGKVPGAVTAKVVTPEGKVVSHFNKHHKGLLARALAQSPVESVTEAVEVAQSAGLTATSDGDVIVITTPAS